MLNFFFTLRRIKTFVVPALATRGIDSQRLKYEIVHFFCVLQFKNWVQSFTRVTKIRQDFVVVNYSFNPAHLVLQQIIPQHSAGSRGEVFMGDCLTEMKWEMQYCSSWMTWGGSGSFLVTVGVRRAPRSKKTQWDGTHFHFWTTDTIANHPDFFQRPWKQHYIELWCNKRSKFLKTGGFAPVGEICDWCLCPLTSLDLNNNLIAFPYLPRVPSCSNCILSNEIATILQAARTKDTQIIQSGRPAAVDSYFIWLFLKELSPTSRPTLRANETLG